MLNFPLYRTLLGVDGQFIISCGNTSWLNHHLKEFLECADKWICHIMYGDVPSLTPIVQTHSSSGDMWRGLSGRFMTFFITIMIFREGEVLIGGLQKKQKTGKQNCCSIWTAKHSIWNISTPSIISFPDLSISLFLSVPPFFFPPCPSANVEYLDWKHLLGFYDLFIATYLF